jgi:hypothetical protein
MFPPVGMIVASAVEIGAEIRRRLALCGKPDLCPLVVPTRRGAATWDIDFTGIRDADLELCLLIVTAVQRSFVLAPAGERRAAPALAASPRAGVISSPPSGK